MTPTLTLRSTRRAAAAVVAFAAVVACAGSGTAEAAQVHVTGPTPAKSLVYWAYGGENNKLKISRLSPMMIRIDDVYALDLSPEAETRCEHPYLLDGTVVDCVAIKDRFLHLHDGNDTVTAGPGVDTVIGGSGYDRVEYGERTGPVTVMLDDKGNDGELGEQDNIRADVEGVAGGAGDDTIVDLVGKANGFHGGPGNDMIVGGDGADATLVGGDGIDSIYGAGGADMLWGDAGDDLLSGGADADLLDGGPDHDTIHSDDGVKDSVFCGIGIDRINADALDALFGCERKG